MAPSSTENPTPNPALADAAAPPPPASAAKRKFDEIIASLGAERASSNQANKPAKRDTFESKSPVDQLTSIAKRFVRAVNPYQDIALVLHYGCQARWGSTSLPEAERAEAKIHADAFDKMLASAPSSAEVIREFWKDPAHWSRLKKIFRDAASNARQGDTTGLKHKLNYLLADTTKSLTPKINETASKSDRGRNHPMLRDAIVPWPLRLTLNETEVAEAASAEPVPTPDAIVALKNLMKGKSADGKKNAPTVGQYPSCFYAEDSFNPQDPSQGLFRSPFLLRVARHIWTTPTTAFDDSGKVPKNCKARAHGQYTWSGEMMGYICGQARTMISASEWTSKEGAYNYERMFNSVVKLFENKTDAWVVDTLAFYQRYVFGSLDRSADDSSENDSDDDSDVSTILALQAARNTPSSETFSIVQSLRRIEPSDSSTSRVIQIVKYPPSAPKLSSRRKLFTAVLIISSAFAVLSRPTVLKEFACCICG
ncbi:hypothetical protein C8F04DRAFT_1313797 [Mycena alexandri]|uniref:Uncharacterized protein n=1 Tax=Mycena alexandri TaxID=1745969 RepID=A0AAD6S837_9AGAR|nr:hypothetical protein C8F04DRAFT_1313797 [Mycena alexandri]